MKVLVLLILLILPSLSSAQTAPTLASSPVAITGLTLQPGYNAVSVSLLNPFTFKAQAIASGAVSGNEITVRDATGTLDIGSRLNPTKQYYLEVIEAGSTGPSFVGDRFEVDVTATIASANDRLTLRGSSPTNTLPTLPDISDSSFVIREHVTLAQVFGGLGNILLTVSQEPTTSDQIQFYDNATASFQTYWFYSDLIGTNLAWRSLDLSDTTDYSTLPIRPGVGVFVFRQTAAAPITLPNLGSVRTHSFRQPLPAGYSLISHPAPLAHSPTTAGMITSNGWTGSGRASMADQIQLWDGNLFTTYWFRANNASSVQQWRNTEDTDPSNYQNVDTFIPEDRAIFVRKLNAAPLHTVNLLQP